MGTTVFTYHVRGCTQAKCLEMLAKVKSPRAFVSAEHNDWVTVVDEDADAFRLDPLKERVARISKTLCADCLITAVYDDDMTLYVAYHAGKEVDRFADGEELYEEKHSPGNSVAIAKAFAWWEGQTNLEKVLRKKYKMEASRLKDIAEAFGIMEHRAMTKLADISYPSPISPAKVAMFPPDTFIGKRLRDRLAYIQFNG